MSNPEIKGKGEWNPWAFRFEAGRCILFVREDRGEINHNQALNTTIEEQGALLREIIIDSDGEIIFLDEDGNSYPLQEACEKGSSMWENITSYLEDEVKERIDTVTFKRHLFPQQKPIRFLT